MTEEAPPDDDSSSVGPCCACGGTLGVRTVVMLNKKAPVAGTGWGCFVCDLSSDGAVAVLCETCFEAELEPIEACVGYPSAGKRIGIGELTGEHKHDAAKHSHFEGRGPDTPIH